jgi:hypothetical protein
MKIRGLEASDVVVIGLVDRKGGIQKWSVSGKRKVESGVATVAFDLRETCPKDNNCGWWLFVMTPRVVTSAIEILPWKEERVIKALPQASKTTPGTASSKPSPAQSDNPMAGCAEIWYGRSVLEVKGEKVEAWVGSISGTSDRRLCLKFQGSIILAATMKSAKSWAPRRHVWVAKFDPLTLGLQRYEEAQLFYDVDLDGNAHPLVFRLFGEAAGVMFPFGDLQRQ